MDEPTGGPSGKGGETVVIDDRTVMFEDSKPPPIFGWLINLDDEEIFRISSDCFDIGSAEDVDLKLKGTDIKQTHCSIYFSDKKFELNDHNTKIGTRINDRLAKRKVLEDNDIIGIGKHKFLFKSFKGG